MSAADIPPVPIFRKKVSSQARHDAYEAPNPTGQPAPFGSDFVIMKRPSKHITEPKITPALVSDGSRIQKPSKKALAIVNDKLSSSGVTKLSIQKASDIAFVSQNQRVSSVSASAKPSRSKNKSRSKRMFSDKLHVIDADFVEMREDDSILEPSTAKKSTFKKAEPKAICSPKKKTETKTISASQRKEEPAAMQAISEHKAPYQLIFLFPQRYQIRYSQISVVIKFPMFFYESHLTLSD